MTAVRDLLTQSAELARRNLLRFRRTPGSILAEVTQPVIFVLLLAYVFGGSLGGGRYPEFMMAGIFVQNVTFKASYTTLGLATDLSRGMVDRFRALPMSRVAVVSGRVLSDLVISVFGLVGTSLCGLLVGWRVRGSLLDAVTAYLLLLLFAFAVSWLGAYLGLAASSVEVAGGLGALWMLPLTFVSSGFVSINAMPAPLAVIAEWNPLTALANSLRHLFGNPTPPGLDQPAGWPAQHSVLYAVLWSITLIVVFGTLSVRRYSRKT